MKPDIEFDPSSVPSASRSYAYPLVAAGTAVSGILLLYGATVLAIAQTWSSSETFKHGWLVVPIVAWLVWRERARVPLEAARVWWPALVGVAVAGFGWLVGNVASVASVQQFALIVMLQSAVLALLGPRVSRSLAFPLAFLFFAVPVGDFMIPTLIDWTADFTVGALRVTGIPVYREGNVFVIPSGTWSVVEACSGVRYLIASMMVGTLYAYMTYRSKVRRALFVTASLVVPIVANWLRAFLIVLLGHFSDNALATGVDHLVYGWIFFGLVIAILFWAGSFWREDGEVASTGSRASPLQLGRLARSPTARPAASAALATLALAAAWPLVAHAIGARTENAPVALTLPESANGWQRGRSTTLPWSPTYVGAAATQSSSYERAGRAVHAYVAYYRAQTQGRELVSSANALLPPAATQLRERPLGALPLRWSGASVDARSSEVISDHGRWLTASWYWVDGALTANDYRAKARQAIARLTFRGDDGAVVILVAPEHESVEEARATLQAFASEMGPSLTRAIVNARGEP